MDISKLNLDGAWEPNHIGPRVEIWGNHLTRLWRGSPVLETVFALKTDGDRTLLDDSIYAELEGTWKYAARDATLSIRPGCCPLTLGATGPNRSKSW